MFTVIVRPFDIPQETSKLSDVTIDRLRAPFYKSANEDASVVVLIDDAKLLESGLRWPLPAREWNSFLTQFHFGKSATVFLDLMLTELREFPLPLGPPPEGASINEKQQRCRPCEGGARNPIASLACYFEPALTVDPIEADEKLAARRAVCPNQITNLQPTALVAAGANPMVADRAMLGQSLPRCRRPNNDEIDQAQALMTSTSKPPSAEDTVLTCLGPASTVAPIQWRAPAGQYPLIIPTGEVTDESTDSEALRYEPSVAFAMFASYCAWLNDQWDLEISPAGNQVHATIQKVVPRPLPTGCRDYVDGKISFERLVEDAQNGSNEHFLDLEWRSEPPQSNYTRTVIGCDKDPSKNPPPLWQAIELFYSALFANISEPARKRLAETCPPLTTVVAGMPPAKVLADDAPKDFLEDKAIFIGHHVGVAPDRHATPIHLTLPGIYVHAMAFDNLLSHGINYNHPSQTIAHTFDIKASEWPFLQPVLSLSWIVLVEALATLVMGRIALEQYWARADAPDFPSLEDELRFFLIAVAVIGFFVALRFLRDLPSLDFLTGLAIDWILLLGVALGAFATGARTLIVKGLLWLFRPAPPRTPLSTLMMASPVDNLSQNGETDALFPDGSEIRPQRDFFERYGVIFIKIGVACSPLLLLFHSALNLELAHISFCLSLGIVLLITWALIGWAIRFSKRLRPR